MEVGDGESGGCRGVSVHHGVDLGTRGVAAQMYLELAGRLVSGQLSRFNDLVVGVHLDEHFGLQQSLTGSGWGGDEVAVGESCRDIAVVCGNESELPQLVADITYCFLDFLFGHGVFLPVSGRIRRP